MNALSAYLEATLLNGLLDCMHQLIHIISCNHDIDQLSYKWHCAAVQLHAPMVLDTLTMQQ